MKSGNNIILTGIPRSGTTLTCYLLNKLPDTIALFEPMEVKKFEHLLNNTQKVKYISSFFKKNRRSIKIRKIAITKNIGGIIPSNSLSEEYNSTGLRIRKNVSRGLIKIDKPFSKEGLLIIKHPSTFTALLDLLNNNFKVYATIRNPLFILASWNTVPFPIQKGHIPAAERVDHNLKMTLSKIQDRYDRQFYILNWFFEKYSSYLQRDSIIKYEDIVASCGKVLSVINPEASELNESLQSKNLLDIYNTEILKQLGERLLLTDGVYWQFYDKKEVVELIKR